MIGSMNKFVKVASFIAAVALVLSLSQRHPRVPNLPRKTSLILRSQQALQDTGCRTSGCRPCRHA